MKNEYRYADFEVREDDDGRPVVAGTVIRYGEVAKLPWFSEEVKAGAFGDVESRDLIVNRMHQRSQPLARTGVGLRMMDSSESLQAEVTLPDTTIGRDTAVEVSSRLLRGLSIEFRSTKETFDEKKNHREIVEADLYGFGIVDRPAYSGSMAQMRWQEYRQFHGLLVPDPEPEPAKQYYFVGG